MITTPRPSSTAGLTSRGTLLLALTGAGLALSLLFLLPSLNSSRAAEPRGRGARPEHRQQEKPAPAVELVKPIGDEPEAGEQEHPVTESMAADPAAAGQAQALAVADARPKVEGPPLRFIKESGTKPTTVDHHDMRETTRERRKDRKQTAAANERAFGTDQPQSDENQKMKSRNPDRSRLGQHASKGGSKAQGKGKQKDDG